MENWMLWSAGVLASIGAGAFGLAIAKPQKFLDVAAAMRPGATQFFAFSLGAMAASIAANAGYPDGGSLCLLAFILLVLVWVIAGNLAERLHLIGEKKAVHAQRKSSKEDEDE